MSFIPNNENTIQYCKLRTLSTDSSRGSFQSPRIGPLRKHTISDELEDLDDLSFLDIQSDHELQASFQGLCAMHKNERYRYKYFFENCTEEMFNLNYQCFEDNPVLFLDSLIRVEEKMGISNDGKKILKYLMNDNSSGYTWNSPPLHWVLYATGNLPIQDYSTIRQNSTNSNDINTKYNMETMTCFTSNMNLPEEIGIQMFDLLVDCGADFNTPNLFGETVDAVLQRVMQKDIDIKKQGKIMGRYNNSELIQHILTKYYTY